MDPANRYENVEQLKNELEKIKGQAERKDNGFGSGSYNDMEFGTENNNGESDELPKITLKYFIKTIPGFRRGNFIFMIIAIMMYGMILYAPYSVFIEYKYNTQLQRVIGGIFYMLGCIIPYMYFANIGDIARRLPPRQFNSRLSRILYQIGVGLLLMIVFWGIATTVLPPTN